MSKRFGIVVAILCVAALALSAAAIWLACGSAEQQDVQYVLYLGTNDKDSNEPVFAPEEALRQAEAILRDCFDGYTIQEADGPLDRRRDGVSGVHAGHLSKRHEPRGRAQGRGPDP